MAGWDNLVLASSDAKASRMGSISAEWKACETDKRRAGLPSAVTSWASAATCASVPEATDCLGPLTAARSAPHRASSGSRSASGRETASIAPRGADAINRPRATTSRSASSNAITPARHAATYSPMLWPIRAAGRMPNAWSAAAMANSTMNRAGWVRSVSDSAAVAAVSPHSPSRRAGRSSTGPPRKARPASSTTARKAGTAW